MCIDIFDEIPLVVVPLGMSLSIFYATTDTQLHKIFKIYVNILEFHDNYLVSPIHHAKCIKKKYKYARCWFIDYWNRLYNFKQTFAQ